MINAQGIWYSHKEDQQANHYQYHWTYIPTNKQGIRDIWVNNKADLLKLIAEWNRSPLWHYALTSEP